MVRTCSRSCLNGPVWPEEGTLHTEHAHLLEPALDQTLTFHTVEVLAKSGLSSHEGLGALGSRQTARGEKTVSDRGPLGNFGTSDKPVTVEPFSLEFRPSFTEAFQGLGASGRDSQRPYFPPLSLVTVW